MKPDQRKQFVVFCVIVGTLAGLMTAFGLMIDTQHPPRHIWFALAWGALTALTVYAGCDVWGRLLLSDPPKPVVTPKRKRALLEYINQEKNNY